VRGAVSGGFQNQLESHNLHKTAQAVKAGIARFGEHFKKVLAAEPGFLGQWAEASVNLGHVPDGDKEVPIVSVFHARVEVPDRPLGVLQAAEKIIMIGKGRFHLFFLAT
jgi:hypothetical protein